MNFLNCSPQSYQVVNKSLRKLKLNMGNNLLSPNIVNAIYEPKKKKKSFLS